MTLTFIMGLCYLILINLINFIELKMEYFYLFIKKSPQILFFD